MPEPTDPLEAFVTRWLNRDLYPWSAGRMLAELRDLLRELEDALAVAAAGPMVVAGREMRQLMQANERLKDELTGFRRNWRNRLDTYWLAADGSSLTCGTCGMTSYNYHDVKNRFCGQCKRFFDA